MISAVLIRGGATRHGMAVAGRGSGAACALALAEAGKTREDIARELIGYFKMGLRTFLLDDPHTDEDAFEIQSVFAMAEEAFAGGASDGLPGKADEAMAPSPALAARGK